MISIGVLNIYSSRRLLRSLEDISFLNIKLCSSNSQPDENCCWFWFSTQVNFNEMLKEELIMIL